MDSRIEVHAFWDDEAQVWVAESAQVPGLVTEAETVELLASKLETLIPDLLELNAPQIEYTGIVNLLAEQILHVA